MGMSEITRDLMHKLICMPRVAPMEDPKRPATKGPFSESPCSPRGQIYMTYPSPHPSSHMSSCSPLSLRAVRSAVDFSPSTATRSPSNLTSSS